MGGQSSLWLGTHGGPSTTVCVCVSVRVCVRATCSGRVFKLLIKARTPQPPRAYKTGACPRLSAARTEGQLGTCMSTLSMQIRLSTAAARR
jgi:hypothetical protein